MGKSRRARKRVVAAVAAGTALAGAVTLAVVGQIPVQREGRPVPGATVTLFGPKGEKAGEGYTDERGVAVIPDLPRRPDELIVVAGKDGKIAMRPPRMPSTAATATDRPARPAGEPAVTVSRDGLITVRAPGSDTDLVFRLGPGREPPPEPTPLQPTAPGRLAAVDLDGEAVRACPEPNPFAPITVGPKDEVGASAASVMRRLMPAAGLPTGIGVGIGPDGGMEVTTSEPDEEPPTAEDPFPRKARHRLRDAASGTEVRVGAMFDDQGRLRIGVEITKAPGKGTLHAVALLSPRGDLVPWTAWEIYELWREWWLTVSWTRITEYYVDGELVNRTVERGGWTERWREDLGTFAVPVEVTETMPLWRMAGFDRATGGVKSAGFVYPVTPAMLRAAPFLFVAHVTLPDRDPVVTVPLVFALWLDPRTPTEGDSPVVLTPLGQAPLVALALDPQGAHRALAARTGAMLFGALMEPGDMMTKVTRALEAGTLMLAYGCNAAAQASWLLPYDARPGESAEERRRREAEEEDEEEGFP